jgi:5-methylcytosine-specific restriction endonuclease McrA
VAVAIISRKDALAQGLKRYFTGKMCSRGHVCERQISSGSCYECMRLKSISWRQENPDKAIALNKLGYLKNGERARAQARAWYALNKERGAAARQAWAKANPEKQLAYCRLKNHRRRARLQDSTGAHTTEDLAAILLAQGHLCIYCKASLKRVKRHIDHIMPLSLGGSNDRTNIQMLCAPCNLSKRDIHPVDFARKRGLLL